MPDFRDLLNNADIQDIAASSIAVGDVFYIGLDEANGITPKYGQTYRNKYFVVLGLDRNGNVFGGIVANTEVNKNIPFERQQLHIKLKQSHNAFLKYDSYLDCSKLKEVQLTKFKEFPYKGKLFIDDLNKALEYVKKSKFINRNDLRRFGII